MDKLSYRRHRFPSIVIQQAAYLDALRHSISTSVTRSVPQQMDDMIAKMTDAAMQKQTAALDMSKAAMMKGDTAECMKHMEVASSICCLIWAMRPSMSAFWPISFSPFAATVPTIRSPEPAIRSQRLREERF